MKSKKMRSEKKGISLIMLVITIIVIIILAVAVILSIANNNPIENAKEAKNKHNKATLEEAANIEYAALYANSQIKGETFNTETIRNNLKNQGFSEEDVKKVEITDKGLYIAKYLPIVPTGFVASQVKGETEISTGLVIYEGTTPVTDENIENARASRNQYVWVPVDDISEFVRESFKSELLDLKVYTEPFTGKDDDGNNANISEKEEYNAIYESVKKYHGFYIARYEASKNLSTSKPLSLPNLTPWSSIIWGKSMTDLSGGAVEAARAIYPASTASTKSAVSTLCYGVQWDQTVRFIAKNYPEISKDSTKYGNYDANSKISTGSNPSYAQNNIYDMCGNLKEWTMEANSSNIRVTRGGSYYSSGSSSTLSSRDIDCYPEWEIIMVGFRVALYIK